MIASSVTDWVDKVPDIWPEPPQIGSMLLDNQVLTAPIIIEPICGGSGQIAGNFSAQSVTELAIMLSGGALPAPLNVVEEGVLPPS
jgi:SecD/SecF fusion protein